MTNNQITTNIPAEIWLQIIRELPGHNLQAMSLLTKKFYSLLQENYGAGNLKTLSKLDISDSNIISVWEKHTENLKERDAQPLPLELFRACFLQARDIFDDEYDSTSCEQKESIIPYINLAALPSGLRPTRNRLYMSVRIGNWMLARDILSIAYSEKRKDWEAINSIEAQKKMKATQLAELATWKKHCLDELIEKRNISQGCKLLASEWIRELSQDIHGWKDIALIFFTLSRRVKCEDTSQWVTKELKKILSQRSIREKDELLSYWREKKSIGALPKLSKLVITVERENLLDKLFDASNSSDAFDTDNASNSSVASDTDNEHDSAQSLYDIYSKALYVELIHLIQMPCAKPQLFTEVRLLFALLQGNCNRISYILEECQNTFCLQSLQWMLQIFSSLFLSKKAASDLDQGLYFFFEKFLHLKEELRFCDVLMLFSLGLPKTLNSISSNKYPQGLWRYLLENVEKEKDGVTQEAFEKSFIKWAVKTPRPLVLEYLESHLDSAAQQKMKEEILNQEAITYRKDLLRFVLEKKLIDCSEVLKILFNEECDCKVECCLIALNYWVKENITLNDEKKRYYETCIKKAIISTDFFERYVAIYQLFYFQYYYHLLDAMKYKKVSKNSLLIIIQKRVQGRFGWTSQVFKNSNEELFKKTMRDLCEETPDQVTINVFNIFKMNFSLDQGIFAMESIKDFFLTQQLYKQIFEYGSKHSAYKSLMELNSISTEGLSKSDQQTLQDIQYIIRDLNKKETKKQEQELERGLRRF